MDMSATYYPSAITSANLNLSKNAQATFALLAGGLVTPMDQPNVTLVIRNLAAAFLTYTQTLSTVKDSFAQLVSDVRQLEDELNCFLTKDKTPPCHLNGRLLAFPAWRLGLDIKEWHTQILVGLGAEVVNACLFSSQLDAAYCRHLSSDLKNLSAPEADDPVDEDDLAQLGFGKKWFPRFERITKLIKGLVENPSPNGGGPDGTKGASAAFTIQMRILQTINFPSLKQRAAALNHRNVSQHQLAAITRALRTRVEHGCASSACTVMQILTSLTPELVMRLPLHRGPNEYWTGCVNLHDSVIELNLDCIFPSRRRPKTGTRHLFEISGSVIRSPLPAFMVEFLQKALRLHPSAAWVGDLLEWPEVDVRADLLPDQPSRITPSVARAAQSLGVNAVAMGLPRTLAAAMSWDFSLMPTARAYYARITKEDVSCTWSNYLDSLEWDVSPKTKDQLIAFGSLCCLTDAAATSIFSHLGQQVQDARPGRNGGMARLMDHHNAYVTYVTALVTFCCGLRARKEYQISAADWGNGTPFLLLNDKRSGKRKDDRPVAVCSTVRTALGQWRAHCTALSERLDKLDSSAQLKELKQQLSDISASLEVPLLFMIRAQKPVPMGSSAVWDELPSTIAAPANCGRVYWLNILSNSGFRSSELDVFMRHAVPGLEANASTHPFALGPSLTRIAALQDQKLAGLLPGLQTGLRSA